ncbi:ubiquitin carboxyl-terminal hydrolase 36-like [Thrips palmi]|uniref:Ubiquitin carboxyl-terminal hydrolase 36 n=1 Tax=Thrips palmi TaxID=161013 RepID=A0A6P8YHA5_THRPL|nr:ubiquitin carboxyl-terminal hydrolase 36-like [Thrips palmi]
MEPKGIPSLGGNGLSQLSVSLQVLMNISDIPNLLNRHIEECTRAECLLCSFGKLLKSLVSDDKETLMALLKELYEECCGDAVNDVFDFFALLLSKLQDAQRTVSGTGKESKVEELFGGSQTVTGTCLNCEFSETHLEPFHVLEIPLEKEVETVQEALESYLIGTVEKSRCPECHQNEAVYCAELSETPPVLCLHFLRPTELNEGNEQRVVTISDKLSVSNVNYQLSSVVHSESNRQPTHYTCVLKCKTGSLVQCNDARVKNGSFHIRFTRILATIDDFDQIWHEGSPRGQEHAHKFLGRYLKCYSDVKCDEESESALRFGLA